jgi:hypothetical protein
LRGFLIAVDHGRHPTITPGGAGGPLSGPLPRFNAKGMYLGHGFLLFS